MVSALQTPEQYRQVHDFKENADYNDRMMDTVQTVTSTQDDYPPAKRQRLLAPQKSCSSMPQPQPAQSSHPLRLKCREFFVPAVLSAEGFQRVFKAITGMDFFPCWKPAKKITRFIFRRAADGIETYVFNDESMNVAEVSERLMAEHAKPSRDPVTVEVRSRKVQQDLFIADQPPKFNRKGMEGAILDETFDANKIMRCLYIPEIADDTWLVDALYKFATAEQERLFAVQVPQWARQKQKRLQLIRTEIQRLKGVDRSPTSATFLARSVAFTVIQGVSVLLNGSVRGNYPPAAGRAFSTELLAYVQALGQGAEMAELLPDKRFGSWAEYANFYDTHPSMVDKIYSKEFLHGGASYKRLGLECEAAVRFSVPELPETAEAFTEHLRGRLLQSGGVGKMRPTWGGSIDKILCGSGQTVLGNAIKYVSTRNQWFLMEHKTHVVHWLCTLAGSSDEFNFPAVFMKHAKILHERTDILDAIYKQYDQAIGELATTFERSFLDVLTAIFADLPAFFSRMRRPTEVDVKSTPSSKGDSKGIEKGVEDGTTTKVKTRVLVLKPTAGYKSKKSVICNPLKVDETGMCMTFGRNESNLCVEPDPRVSGNHFAIKLEGTQWVLVDRSTNGTWVNTVKVGKGNTKPLQEGDTIAWITPCTQQDLVGFAVQFKSQEEREPSKARVSSVRRVLREMKKTDSRGIFVLDGPFDPMLVEEFLPKIANSVYRGFEIIRSHVAEYVPLFIEAFFRRPLESMLLEVMAQISIDEEMDLPEIDIKLKRLKAEEAEVEQLIRDLNERETVVSNYC